MSKPRAPKRPVVSVPEGGWQRAAGKKVRLTSPPAESKRPVVPNTEHAVLPDRRLVWRFNEIDAAGAWPPAAIGAQALGDLLKKMASYESMTIGEIFKPESEHGKRYPMDSLPKRARKRLGEIERDDETELARLRCGAKPRLYGFLRGHVFHVVWWDAEHAVYPSQKKHT